MNNVHIHQKVDVIIDVHDRTKPNLPKDIVHVGMMRARRDVVIYMREEIPGYPHIKKYPLKEIIKEFETDYFGSGLDYIVALAIYKGATEIQTYGVCMMDTGEYKHQKSSFESWLSYARGRGIRVKTNGYFSTLFKTHNGLMYGYQIPQSYVNQNHPEVLDYYKELYREQFK